MIKHPAVATSLFLLGSLSTWAQIPASPLPAPSASPPSRTEYGLVFHPELSRLLAETLALGPREQVTVEDCTISGATDGPIVCITEDSCAAPGESTLPFCVLLFSGHAGLTVNDVVELRSLSVAPEGEENPTFKQAWKAR